MSLPNSVTNAPGVVPSILRLAMPVMMEQISAMFVGFVDTWLTARYLPGDENLAAMNVISYVLWLVPSLFAVVAIGSTALVARHVGAGDADGANRATNQAFVIGAFFAVLTVVAGVFLARPFVALTQLEPRAAELATRYVWLLVPALPFVMLEQVGISCLRGAGDTVTGLIALAICNIVQVALSLALVIGWGPFPALGWNGLAIGAAAGYFVGGVIILGCLLWGRAGLRLRTRLLRPHLEMIRRLLRVGLPGGADVMSVIACHIWFISVVNRLGDEASAAHGVAVKIESLAFLPGAAFYVAASTLAGQYLGARDFRRASRSVLVCALMSLSLLSTAGLLFFFGGGALARVFLSDQQQHLVELVVPLLQIVAFGMPALALLNTFTGALRGSGDTRWPLAVTLFGFVLVRMPLSYLLALPEVHLFGLTIEGFGPNLRGAWYAMVIDLFVRCSLVTFRFWQGGWKRVQV